MKQIAKRIDAQHYYVEDANKKLICTFKVINENVSRICLLNGKCHLVEGGEIEVMEWIGENL